MENLKETYNKSENNSDPNATSHYTLMTVGIIIGFIGVMLRFVSTWPLIDIVSNIIFIIGIIICLKSVYDILE